MARLGKVKCTKKYRLRIDGNTFGLVELTIGWQSLGLSLHEIIRYCNVFLNFSQNCLKCKQGFWWSCETIISQSIVKEKDTNTVSTEGSATVATKSIIKIIDLITKKKVMLLKIIWLPCFHAVWCINFNLLNN